MAKATSSEVTNMVRQRLQIGGSGPKGKDTVTEQQICPQEVRLRNPMNYIMEQIQLRNGAGSKCPHFAGYFVQPWASDLYVVPEYPPKLGFIHSSQEGKDLKEDLDVSLSFLGLENIVIVGSSLGFLLCCTDINTYMHYIICNPVTRESKPLPELHRSCAVANMAFLCTAGRATSTSLDSICYEVVRIGMSHPLKATTTLEVDKYSSLTGEWRQSSVISPSPVAFVGNHMPAFVVGDVMFWTDYQSTLLGYDPVSECIQVWDLPWQGVYSAYLGLSEGRIHCAITDRHNLEIWVLEDYTRIGSLSGWILKHRVSFTAMREINPERVIHANVMGIMEFHPWNSQLILVCIFLTPYWYNSENSKLKAAIDFEPANLMCNYIRYEWPYSA